MSSEKTPPSAWKRFHDSMVMDFDKWHDGIGFDLDALREMTAGERRKVAAELAGRRQTWREIEALAVLRELEAAEAAEAAEAGGEDDGDEDDAGATAAAADEAMESALSDPSADTRLAAAEVLLAEKRREEFDQFLAREIRGMTEIGDGLTRALLLAEQYPEAGPSLGELEPDGVRDPLCRPVVLSVRRGGERV